jgi:hypothetical protein
VRALTQLMIWKLCPSLRAWSVRGATLKGCSCCLVIFDHDTMRHMLMQPTKSLYKRQARYVRNF